MDEGRGVKSSLLDDEEDDDDDDDEEETNDVLEWCRSEEATLPRRGR